VNALRRSGYRAIVANAPGTGKTIVTLACVKRDWARLTPTLIVAPASVVTNWCREARKWLGRGVKIHAVTDTMSPLPRKGVAHVVVISWGLLSARADEIITMAPQFLVADEAHYAKSEEAQRTIALGRVARACPHVVLLTGTPVINKKAELETLQELFGTTQVPMIRRFLEDVVPEVPPKTRSTLAITLRDADMREYRRAEGEFSEWLERELRTRMSLGEALASAQRALAAEALVKSGYLRRLLGKAKVFAASDWIARAVRLGEPVVVFCEHQEVIKTLQDLLRRQRIGSVLIDGGVSRKDRQAAIDNFQAGRVPVFIGTKAASTGITLTRARNLLFLERYWTSAEEEQAEDRIRRIGQTKPTNIWFIHATGTIDDRIDQIINRKRRLVAQTVGAFQTPDRDEDAVAELISAWNEKVASPFEGQETDLGRGKPLPPIPAPRDVCLLSFKGARWNAASASAWARLHGYPEERVLASVSGVKVQVQPVSKFVGASFTAVPIAGDIKAVIGKRQSRSTQRGRARSQKKKA
jgi:SNF2 family DNA or RNA helicase